MIKKLIIQNIQSHKETTLEFSSGINAIVGSSNNGKSAILRALFWVRYNRPMGIDNLLSHWAVDKKGNQSLPMLATVENENGFVTRKRTKTENQYIVNSEELNVVKTDVPEQVEKLLALSDTNIQRQQDAPFLLSLSSGQVAQYFNKTVRLDVIDKVLSNAESKRRKTMRELNQNEELCAEYETRLEKYSWLESVEKLLEKYDVLEKKAVELDDRCNQLEEQVKQFEKFAGIKEKYKFVDVANCEWKKIYDLDYVVNQIDERIEFIKDSLQDYANCSCRIYPSFEEQENLIVKFESLCEKQTSDEDFYAVKEEIEQFEYLTYKIIDNNRQAVELKKQLPKVCPLCGAPMKDGKCLEE